MRVWTLMSTLLLIALSLLSCREPPAEVPPIDVADQDSTLDLADAAPDEEPDLTTPACGNGLVEPGEACDDGNSSDSDGCLDGPSGLCLEATCGDGFLDETSEDCEPGQHSEDGYCNVDCSLTPCPDGQRNCDGDPDNECEVNVASDRRTCGACDNHCGETENCADGQCYDAWCSYDFWGRWDAEACGHSVCGELDHSCEDPSGGCDCGPVRTFVPGEGCVLAPECGPAPRHPCAEGTTTVDGLGRQCDTDADCSDLGDAICRNAMCTFICSSNEECGTGAFCAEAPTDYICNDDGCLPETCCNVVKPGCERFCVPDSCCLTDENCEADEICDMYNGVFRTCYDPDFDWSLWQGYMQCRSSCEDTLECAGDETCLRVTRNYSDVIHSWLVCGPPERVDAFRSPHAILWPP